MNLASAALLHGVARPSVDVAGGVHWPRTVTTGGLRVKARRIYVREQRRIDFESPEGSWRSTRARSLDKLGPVVA